MNLRQFFPKRRGAKAVDVVTAPVRASIAIPADKVDEVAGGMQFRREWFCICGARLAIRARQNRADGPSNFTPWPDGHPLAGHSQVRSEDLTWNGLAEERGWAIGEQICACPACQCNMTVPEFKQARRAAQAQAALEAGR